MQKPAPQEAGNDRAKPPNLRHFGPVLKLTQDIFSAPHFGLGSLEQDAGSTKAVFVTQCSPEHHATTFGVLSSRGDGTNGFDLIAPIMEKFR